MSRSTKINESSESTFSETDTLIANEPPKEEPVKGNSPAVIFSIWSTMIGSTLLSMPRVVRNTGIVSALCGTALMCLSNTYTVLLMERLGRVHENSLSAVMKDAGPKVYLISMITSVIVLLGANTIYQIYICDGLMTLAHFDTTDKQKRPIFAVCIGAAFFLIGFLRSLKPLFLAAGYAIVIVIFLVCFIIVKAALELTQNNECNSNKLDKAEGLVWTGFGPFVENCSTMALSLNIHPIILSVLSLATKPSNNPRDLSISFVATAISVVGPGALAAYAFRYCGTIDSDFLVMFDDPFTIAARVAVILLVCIVYPILLFNARNQLLGILLGEEFPYWAHVVFNVVAIALTTIPCALDIATTVVASAAGIGALFWVSFIPVCLWMYHVKRREPEKMTPMFYIVNLSVLALGAMLVVTTIMSLSSNLLD